MAQLLAIAAVVVAVSSCAPRASAALSATPDVVSSTAAPLPPAPLGPARSIILFIGDGMGYGHSQAAQWFSVGQEGQLQMNTLPVQGSLHTGSRSSGPTDSAAAATALAAGVKTFNGVLGRDAAGQDVTTILELAQLRGMAVGLVSTTQAAHATPAGFAAHVSSRNMKMDIAEQIAAADINVILAGGEDDFLPQDEDGCYIGKGKRYDDRDLVTEMVDAGYTYICKPTDLAGVPLTTTHLVGLFGKEGMARPHAPTLAQMTDTAIQLLSQDHDGFFLMVEGGQIDWAAHDNEAADVIADILALDEAVSVGLSFARNAAVPPLIIVTADHETGGMSADLQPTGESREDGAFEMPDGTPFWVNWTCRPP